MNALEPDIQTECESPVAIILAAGEGCRLADHEGSPKPLVSVVGLSLAERCICGLLEAGVRRFVVVLGHEAERVRSHFEDIGRQRDCEIAFVVAQHWAKGNGSSALAAHSAVGDPPFLLTMVDHLLSPAAIEEVLAYPPSAGEITLGVDGAKDNVFDPADVTRVCRQNGRVVAIGKELEEWNAGDTGLFYCTGAIFLALERAQSKGAYSLTDGVLECIDNGGVRAVDVSAQPWLDVDTPEALAEAELRIRASLCKGQDDGFISQHLNRVISRPISLRLARTPITPNQITVTSFLLGMFGAVLLAFAELSYWIAGGIIIQAASILDGCDGEIARLKYLQSAGGAWLDTILDRYADAALAIAVTLSAARVVPAAPWVWVSGCTCAVGFLMASYITKEYQIRFGRPYPNTVIARLKRRDLRILIVAVGAIMGHPFTALLVVGFLSHFSVIWILLHGANASEPTRRPSTMLNARVPN